MTPILQQIIAETTDEDRKTVEQKVMKLFEEGGELSRAILQLRRAHGTKYRAKPNTIGDVVEEIADCHIVLYSIAYKLGIHDHDIAEAIGKKIAKWQKVLRMDDQDR